MPIEHRAQTSSLSVCLVDPVYSTKQNKRSLCFSLVVLKATLTSVLTCMSKLRALFAFIERPTQEFIPCTQLQCNIYNSGYREK